MIYLACSNFYTAAKYAAKRNMRLADWEWVETDHEDVRSNHADAQTR